MNIRSIEERDVDVILAVQKSSPEIAQWAALDYARVARSEMAGWVAEESGKIVGFVIARQIANDVEVLNLAVRPESRRKGIGTSLLRAALTWGRGFHAEKALLEVRASNLAALRFYERHGFEVSGRRPRYYTAPIEDALLLTIVRP